MFLLMFAVIIMELIIMCGYALQVPVKMPGSRFLYTTIRELPKAGPQI